MALHQLLRAWVSDEQRKSRILSTLRANLRFGLKIPTPLPLQGKLVTLRLQ